jgi:7-cyano-7-deazaguanine synthase in queuosine biosynthesis
VKSLPSDGAVRAALQFQVEPDGATHVHVAGLDGEIVLDSHYFIKDERFEEAFGASLRHDLADLAAVALAVYVADRLIRRSSHSDRSAFAWSRQLHLRIPLRAPERWVQLANELSDLLWWCTEDEWTFDFVVRPATTIGPERAVQAHLLPPTEPPVRAALFSGGLDSFAGLCDGILQDRRGTVVLLCASTHGRLTNVQQELTRAVMHRTGVKILPVIVPFGFHRQGRTYNADESSQRTRGLVFIALGAVAARLAGCDRLDIYENGIGILNLPYTEAQLGANTSRSVHPRTMAAMEQLVEHATGQPLYIEPTALWRTKGQLNAAIGELGLADLVPLSVSCDGYPQRVTGKPVCGICPSCLLRRQSLHAAGLLEHDDATSYRWDILQPGLALNAEQLYPWRAMLDQVARLDAALSSSYPWESLCRLYPVLADLRYRPTAVIRSTTDPERAIIDLYRRYVAEWQAFPASPSVPMPEVQAR